MVLKDIVRANVDRVISFTNLTNKDLALILNVSTVQISRRMRGRMEFRLSELDMISDFLDINVLSFFKKDMSIIDLGISSSKIKKKKEQLYKEEKN